MTYKPRKALFTACTVILLATTSTTHALTATETAQEMIAALSAQVAELTARLEQVEQSTARASVPTEDYQVPRTSAPQKSAASWAETIKMNGDFRYRHEAFDVENRRERHRQRMRARVSITGEVSDTVTAGFRLATGGNDPISTNQSFDDASSSKGVVIDQAYVNWKTPIDGLKVSAGKFKNPLHRVGSNSLLWDGDLNPEGVGATYKNGGFFANALASWVDESSSDDDSFLVGGQLGNNIELGDNAKLKAGLGYYNYLDARGEPAFFDGDAQGNLLNADGEYISGFELVEGFVEYVTKLDGKQLTLFADYVKNLEADDYDQGYAVGAKLKAYVWQWGYTYQDLEADAVLGTFTDSDFIGGGTDGKGHILQVGYAVSKRIGLRGTLFLNDRNVDFGTEEEFKRLMLDISFKY